MMRSSRGLVIAWAVVLSITGCGLNFPLGEWLFQTGEEYEAAGIAEQAAFLAFFDSPIRAFHADGTISVFREDYALSEDLEYLVGEGTHYSLDLNSFVVVERVPLDSLVGLFPAFSAVQ